MKVDLIGMIFNTGAQRYFEGFVTDDDGKELNAHESLDILIMEYAKVKNGGTSELVVVRDIKKDAS